MSPPGPSAASSGQEDNLLMPTTINHSRRGSNLRKNSMIMNFNNTLFGQYRDDLYNFRRKEVEKQQLLADANKLKESEDKPLRTPSCNACMAVIRRCFQHQRGDLVMLAMLAVMMATLSFLCDRIIEGFTHCKCQSL